MMKNDKAQQVHAEMARLRPHILDGYRAALAGRAWVLGWRIGSLPWPVRWIVVAPLWWGGR